LPRKRTVDDEQLVLFAINAQERPSTTHYLPTASVDNSGNPHAIKNTTHFSGASFFASISETPSSLFLTAAALVAADFVKTAVAAISRPLIRGQDEAAEIARYESVLAALPMPHILAQEFGTQRGMQRLLSLVGFSGDAADVAGFGADDRDYSEHTHSPQPDQTPSDATVP
jgi:hypothetical protein